LYNQLFIKAAVQAGISIVDHKETKPKIILEKNFSYLAHTLSQVLTLHSIMLYATLESTVLEISVKNSLDAWRRDLKYLVEHAKDRFPDVIWEHDVANEGSNLGVKESIWGHKGVFMVSCSAS